MTKQGSAPIPVNQHQEGKMVPTMYGRNAFVVDHFSRVISTKDKNIVQRVVDTGRFEEVFNVKTKTGMFYANNVLTSNCDAVRYFIVSRPRLPEKEDVIIPNTPAWRIREMEKRTTGGVTY